MLDLAALKSASASRSGPMLPSPFTYPIIPSVELFSISSFYWQIYCCYFFFFPSSPFNFPTFVDSECFNHENANKC